MVLSIVEQVAEAAQPVVELLEPHIAALQAQLVQYLPALADPTLFYSTVGVTLSLPLLVGAMLRGESVNRPPRFNYLGKALTGKFDMKEQGPIGLIKAGIKAKGEIFSIKVGTKNITFLTGPDATKFFFEAKDSELSSKECYSFMTPVFGKGIVYDAPHGKMTEQLKFLKTALTGQAMDAHSNKIAEETRKFFSEGSFSGDDFKIEKSGHEFSALTIASAGRCLLGNEIVTTLKTVAHEVADHYFTLEQGITHLSFFWPTAPTKAHADRDVARAKMDVIFKTLIKARRAKNDAGDHTQSDLLQVLIDSKYRDGSQCTDDQIVGLLVAALFAGQHTSSITSTWMTCLIACNRNKNDLLKRLLAEQKEVLDRHGGELNFAAVGEMQLLHQVFMETLRLFPPLILLMRQVTKTRTYKDYQMPPGDILMVCPSAQHRVDKYFKNADEFDPDRFGPGREEHMKQKYTYIPFGGGRHSCLGERFGYLQVKTIVSVMIREFDIAARKDWQRKPDYANVVVGPQVGTCNLRFRRKSSPFEFDKDFTFEEQ